MTGLLDRPLGREIGEKSAKQLAKLSIHTVGDLLTHYPRRYYTRGDMTDIGSLSLGDHVTVLARVLDVRQRSMHSKRGVILQATIGNGITELLLTFFAKHPGALAGHLKRLGVGEEGLFSGVVSEYQGRRQLTHPDFEMLDETRDVAEAIDARMRPVPVYPATASLPTWRIANAVDAVIRLVHEEDLLDIIPPAVRRAHLLLTPFEALYGAHQPETHSDWQTARRTIAFEEAFLLLAVLARRRAEAATHRAVPRPRRAGGILEAFDARLPYELTGAQQRAGEILADGLEAEHPTQRLLQGEVGSGKTLVALRAMLQVVDAGGQAVLLAPTEVLAQQHLRSITHLLGDLGAGGMLGAPENATAVRLLTAALTASERRHTLADIASGEAGIVVGTHALLGEHVMFADLGLVVVDEQHRFGVEQRDLLRDRGEVHAHSLVMTATPIPRTVAMTVFGDLEVVTLDELPAGRPPVETFLVDWDKENWVRRVWARCAEEVAKGGRVYVVCPRIDATAAEDNAEAPEGASDRPTAAVLEWVERLQQEPALTGIGVGMLHGRMSTDAKDRAMAEFAAGTTPVLVSTTVVEVGVDVPEATAMVILDADHFGLSQLHQLRGRIGRGTAPSVCFALAEAPEANERLAAFAASRDGFALADKDLELRREGDVLGSAQSGGMSSLVSLRVIRDRELIEEARGAVEGLAEKDPTFAEYPELAAAIARVEETQEGEFLSRA